MRRIVLSTLLFTACSFADPATPSSSGQNTERAPYPLIGEASVALTKGGAPASGIDVVFHDVDGRPIAHLVTDAGGEARAQIPVNAKITLIRPGEISGHELLTVHNVENGDRVALDLTGYQLPKAGVDVAVTWAGAFEGAAEYSIATDCTNAFFGVVEGITTSQIEAGCSGDRFNVYARAHDSNGRLVAWALARDVEKTAAPMTIDLGAWRTDLIAVPVVVPENSSWTIIPSIDPLIEGVNGREWSRDFGSATFFLPDLGTNRAALTINGSAGVAGSTSMTRIVALDAPVTIDERDLLPPVDNVRVANNNTLEFDILGDSTGADAVCAAIYYDSSRWMAFGPSDSRSISFPRLPAELSHLQPISVQGGGVNLFDRELIGTWSALRENPSETLSTSEPGRSSSANQVP